MSKESLHILLADDDEGDQLLFKEALQVLPITTRLTTVSEGEQLMGYLATITSQLPHLLFLDLNMPRKNGFECLIEIKRHEKFKDLPVIIFSTSDDQYGIDKTYENGAHLYVVKPGNFPHLIKSIRQAIILSLQTNFVQPPKNKFVLNNSGTL